MKSGNPETFEVVANTREPEMTTGVSRIDLTDLAAARGGSQPLHGFLVRPTGAGPWPGVVMVHEVLGLDDVMRR